MHLLIPYVHLYNHPDPYLEEFTYGDASSRGKKIKRLEKGDYVFFHTSIRGKKYITAYYVVDRILGTAQAVKDLNIMNKFKNPHLREYLNTKSEKDENDCVLFGDPILSRKLEKLLLFDKTLAKKLSLNINFSKDMTETQAIGSATRSWRNLTDKDIKVLLNEIKSTEESTEELRTILSSDEVTEIIEKNLEDFIYKNPKILGKSLNFISRQTDTKVGRIDLLYEDKQGNPIVVELKLDKIGWQAINQVRRYIKWANDQTKKKAKGIIVCKGVMPVFEKDFKKLRDIKIFCYGWQLKIFPWKSGDKNTF